MRRHDLAAILCGLGLALLLIAAAIAVAVAMPARPVPYDENGQRVAAGSGLDKSAGAPQPGPGVDGRYPGVKGAPGGGIARLPVLLVQFPEWLGVTPTPAFVNMLLSTGTYPTGSMNDYFREQGLTAVTGQVVNWVTVSNSRAYYVNRNSAMLNSYPANSQGLVREAVLAANPSINFANFDNDGPDGVPNSGDDDGIVDCLIVVCAGYAAESFSPPDPRNQIWSHYWWLSAGAGPGALTVDGVKVDPYTIQSELRGTSGSQIRDIGVFCHEYGHGLGLPDLWSTTPQNLLPNFGTWNGIGCYDLMGFGGWGAGGANPDRPFHMSALSKAMLGLANVITVDIDRLSEPINAVETSRDVYWISPVPWQVGVLIDSRPGGSPTWNVQPWGLQGWFVENRQQLGFDAGLPSSGLLVYHFNGQIAGLDYDGDGFNNYIDNAFEWSETRPVLRLECADQTGLDHARDNDDLALQNNLGDAGDFWSTATATAFDLTTVPSSVAYPVAWPSPSSPFSLYNVSASAPVMTADLIVGLPGGPNDDVWLKDCVGDDGTVPSYSNCQKGGPLGVYSSPDISIDNNFDGIADNPVTNNAYNYLFVKVRNRGVSAASVTTVDFYDLTAYGMAPPRPSPTPNTNPSWVAARKGTMRALAFAPGDSATVSTAMWVPASAPPYYAPTYAAYVHTATDSSGTSGDVCLENNIAVCARWAFYAKANRPVKSETPSVAGRKDDWEAMPIEQLIPVSNPDMYTRLVTVEMESEVPASWTLSLMEAETGLAIPTPYTVELDPLEILELLLIVDPGAGAAQGESGYVKFTEYATELFPAPEGIVGGMIMPIEVDVREPMPVMNLTSRLVDHPPCIGPAVSAHLTWDPVLYDSSGELDPPAYYQVYRLEAPLLPLSEEDLVATVTHDGIEGTECWDFSDDGICDEIEDCNEDLVADLWYAVVAIDKAGNRSDVLEFVHPTGVPDDGQALPRRVTVHQNQPNPFNPRTLVLYATPADGPVKLSIYDVRGRFVKTLVDESLPAGEHETAWDGRDAEGRSVAGGVYVARVESAGQTSTCKMTLAK